MQNILKNIVSKNFLRKAVNIWNTNYFHLSLFMVFSILLFSDTIKHLVKEWNVRPDASHGWLIPFIAAYIIIKKKEETKPLVSDKRSFLAISAAFIAICLFLLGKISLVLTFERFGFWLFMVAATVYIIGKKAAIKLVFPIAYTIFMIPMPVTLYDWLTFPFKKMATIIAVAVISAFSVPVYREGNVIHLSKATLEIANACSGLNTMIAVLALGVVWSYFMLHVRWKQIVFVFMLLPIAIIANAVRIITTAFIANFYSEKITQGLLHEFSGAVFVLVVAFSLIILSHFIIRRL